MIQITMSKAEEVKQSVRGTYGLYSKGRKVVSRRGRACWTDGGWYATTRRRLSNNEIEEQESLVSMRKNWGRKTPKARSAVRGMWSTRAEAEAAALLIVVRHPEWLGSLEVRRLVL